MRKLKSFILAPVLALVLLILPFGSVYASSFDVYADDDMYYSAKNKSSGYELVVYDEADFLHERGKSDYSYNDILRRMKDITEYSNVAVVTTEYHSKSSTEKFAQSICYEEFGKNSDSVVFVIDRCLNQIYIWTNGKTHSKINERRCTYITDNTYFSATKEGGYDYVTCTYESINQCGIILEGGKIVVPMKYVSNAFIALALGMLVCYFIARATSRSKKASTNEVLGGTFTQFRITSPRATMTNQTRTYSPPSSSGGGGGGHGGGGGGGGHSGGGGGHGI